MRQCCELPLGNLVFKVDGEKERRRSAIMEGTQILTDSNITFSNKGSVALEVVNMNQPVKLMIVQSTSLRFSIVRFTTVSPNL